MGLFNMVRSTVSNQFDRERHSSWVPRWTSPPARNTSEWLTAFNKNPRLAVVERIASDLSFATGKLFAIDDNGDEKELSKHPFLTFWQDPNPLHEMSNAALWRLIEIYLMLKGEGYFAIEKDALGRPRELWPVPTHWVQMTPYIGFPFFTVRLTNGVLMQISVDDMFFMKDLDPFDPYKRGRGQAEPLADEIETDEYAAKFQKKFFYNDATPNLIIAMPGSDAEQRKRFRSEWMERFQGMFKSHGVATVNGEMQIHKIAENMKDMDMIEGRKFLRDAALEHFGVPREIMGITESSNRSTSEAAQFIHAQNVLMPRLRRREEAINHQMLPAFGDNLIWRFDDIVPKNQEFDKARAIEGWNAGLLTKDQALELLGMAPAKSGGDVYKTQFSDVYIRAGDNPAEISASVMNVRYADEAPLVGEGDEKQMAVRNYKAQRDRVAEHSLDAAMLEQHRRFERTTIKFSKEQVRRIGEALSGKSKAQGSVWDILRDYIGGHEGTDYERWQALTEDEKKSLVDSFVDGLVDWDHERKVLIDLFSPLWKETYDKGAQAAQRLYGVTAVKRPELYSHAKLNGGTRITNIEETTKRRIGRIVADCIESGEGRKTLTDAIMQEAVVSPARARLIADQETITSLQTGQYDMMEAAGATSKTWHHRPQKDPRDGKNGTPNHVAMDGETVPIGEKFSNGLRFPRDPEGSDPAQVINCRCYIAYGLK